MKQKNELQADLLADQPAAEPVKSIVLQDTIWENMVEVRCYCADGKVYAAFYMGDEKATEFSKVPDKKEQ